MSEPVAADVPIVGKSEPLGHSDGNPYDGHPDEWYDESGQLTDDVQSEPHAKHRHQHPDLVVEPVFLTDQQP